MNMIRSLNSASGISSVLMHMLDIHGKYLSLFDMTNVYTSVGLVSPFFDTTWL